ncbi:hypothetical protein BABINDRAFT_36409 [Babjeviella inositovora NRRL Y-12698]|uniref:C2 domain-containing protein n=1 Tax=Babjeviella inositovora NRRL Y-12698 TaxID=984486 RepID=A0A1E3QQS3_9ASCO|nr:uncharacterized protein BABINDRAFT_36409 [Babjeviella inositovora NRRL Y-12698]ODQ80043.1 hypothetical protein BABINDRAFT_36409 [Babjeviella inositovora NRRL Y-12698]
MPANFRATGPISSADGTLIIISCKGKHLPNRRKLEKQNPYVLLRIGSIADRSSYDFRGGQTPEWNHESRFELTADRPPLMKLDVLDDTKDEPTPIGSAEIDCTPVFSRSPDGRYIYDDWFKLSLLGKPAGIIRLEMTFYPLVPLIPPKGPLASSIPTSMNNSLGGMSQKTVSPPYGGSSTVFSTPPGFNYSQGRSQGLSSNYHKELLPRPNIPSLMDECAGTSQKPLRTVSPASSLFQNNNQETLNNTFESTQTKSKGAKIISKFTKKIDQKSPLHSTGGARRKPPSDDYSIRPIPQQRHSHDGANTNTPMSELLKKLNLISLENEIPYSAEEIGLVQKRHSLLPVSASFGGAQRQSWNTPRRETAPTSGDIYFLGSKLNDSVQDNNHDTDVYDPAHFAPTPMEHFTKSQRLQMGREYVRKNDLKVEYGQSGYQGNGTWAQESQDENYEQYIQRKTQYSPPKFNQQAAAAAGFSSYTERHADAKPGVPPKVPIGMTEKEYYLLEKDSYLRDIHGRRL